MKTMEERILEQINATKEVQAISFVALAESGQIDAETASNHKDLFKEWTSNANYNDKQIVRYEDVLYKVIQSHVSQDDWKPTNTPSLYEPLILNNSGYPLWNKPSGSHDAYNTGDIVDYNGTLYKSLIDSNIYSPDEYPSGWEIVK